MSMNHLPLRTAFNLYWLGRYMARIEVLCRINPLEDDTRAAHFAKAFALPAWNAETLHWLLNEPTQPVSILANLKNIHQNTQEVRGCVSRDAYSALNALWRLYDVEQADYCGALNHAMRQLGEQLPEAADPFWHLGLVIERLDAAMRLEQGEGPWTEALGALIARLPPGWHGLQRCLTPDALEAGGFYVLCSELNDLFTEGPVTCC